MNSRYGAAPTHTPPKPTSMPADEVQILDEHLAAVEPSVAVGVFEDQDAILALAFRGAHRIGVRLGDPQPAAIVERERDRPHHVGLGGRERHREALRHGHRPRRLDARQARRAAPDPSAAAAVMSAGDDLVREERPRIVKAEAVEVDVRPGILLDVGRGGRAGLLVDEPDEDVLAAYARRSTTAGRSARAGRRR